MHGHSHVYNQQTKKKIILIMVVRLNFMGLNMMNNLTKIALGLKKFRDNNIKIRSFFAPNHCYLRFEYF